MRFKTFAQWWAWWSIGTGATHDAQAKRIARRLWREKFGKGHSS